MKKIFLLLICLFCFSSALYADSSSFNPTAVGLSPKITDGIPIGTVITWSSNEEFPLINGNKTWLACDGQAIPAGVEYQKLRILLKSEKLPNYNNGQFLRGANNDIGKNVAQSIIGTELTIPAHKHDLSSGTAGGQTIVSGGAGGQTIVSGGADGQTIVSGGAGGQTFVYEKASGSTGGGGGTQLYEHEKTDHLGNVTNEYRYQCIEASYKHVGFSHNECKEYYGYYIEGRPVGSSGGGGGGEISTSPTSGTTSGGSIWGTTSGSSIWGTTSGGSIYGTTSASGLSGATGEAGSTTMTVRDVATPEHTKVKYYIKAMD